MEVVSNALQKRKMNPQQHNLLNSASGKLLSFDDISAYFSMPLSDAASHLGVCVSLLKRICRENGLDRWPYRKVLAGRSIDDIKTRAAREQNEEFAEQVKAGRQSSSQRQNSGNSKLQVGTSHKMQLQGTKDVQHMRLQNVHVPMLSKGIAALDEFKYGFPSSDGLSVATNKWWGSCSIVDGTDRHGCRSDEDKMFQYKDVVVDDANPFTTDEKKTEKGKIDDETIDQETGLLTAARMRAVQEGEALKLGVFRTFDTSQLGQKKQLLLPRIFGSSLLKECFNGSS